MQVVRTPDRRFESLPGFEYRPRYVSINSGDGGEIRIHYIDEGDTRADPVLMLHGEPTWSFAYRRVIAYGIAAGLRCLAPDLVGFGRSDKPLAREDHTYERHVRWMLDVIRALDLQRITLLCHDWGGLIGLRLVAEHPGLFAAVIASNTTLPTGDRLPPDAFLTWQHLSQAHPELAVGLMVQSGCVRRLSPDVIAAYDAPFPDETYKAGVRQLPMLVATTPNDPASVHNRRAWQSLSTFQQPFLTIFSDRDPLTAGADRVLQRRIPGAAGRNHVVLHDVGHFVQEDAGDELARLTVAFVTGMRKT